MSSRFVSGGTLEPSGDEAAPAEAAPRAPLSKNTEWEAVQEELEADRKRREEERVKAAAGEEKSLYEVLQANKAAKQAAFEEQNKIRNQFRALDDDEIEFLDEVVAAKRKEEDRVRRETEEGLRAFREQQRRGSGGGSSAGVEAEAEVEDWGVGRKRKRAKEKEKDKGVVKKKQVEEKEVTAEKTEQVPQKKSLGLVDYGSDSDDE